MGLASLFESRAIRDPKWGEWARAGDLDDVPAGNTASGIQVTPESSTQLVAVYACASLIADTMATMDARHVRLSDSTEVQPRPSWLDDPDGESDWESWLWSATWSLVLRGELFVTVLRDRAGQIATMDVVAPDRVERRRPPNGGKPVTLIDGKAFNGEFYATLAQRRPGSLRGLSPIAACSEAIGGAIAAQNYGATFFGRAGRPEGVIEAPAMTMEQATELRTAWRRSHSGPSRANTTGILFGGASYKPITIAPEEAQFLETRQYTAAETCGIFHVPPVMIGASVQGSALTYANVETQWVDYMRKAVMPHMARVQRLFRRLLPPGQGIVFVPDVYLRPDTLVRFQAHQLAISNGIYSAAEARAMEAMLPNAEVTP